jgi:hypothetical protein
MFIYKKIFWVPRGVNQAVGWQEGENGFCSVQQLHPPDGENVGGADRRSKLIGATVDAGVQQKGNRIRMKKHFVYFYGSTRIISGHNSLKEESIRKRNQIIGFEGIDVNPELIEYGEICFNKINNDGSRGETGTMYPKNITIVPFRYLYQDTLIVRYLEDAITANEEYVKADSMGFPLMMLKSATSQGYDRLGKDWSFFTQDAEIQFKKT